MKHQLPKLLRPAPLVFAFLATLMVTDAMAAGRTYKPHNEENSPKFELCRLKKRDYVDGGTNCIYGRQTGGKDVVIKVDDKKVRCQTSFQCKRIN